MIKIRKGAFQHVESELYAFPDTRREIVRLKNDILHGKSSEDENVGGGRSSLPSDPTGRTAVLLTSHRKLEQLERIHDAIETVYNMLPEERKKIIRFKYWTRPQVLTWDGIALESGVSRITAIRWRDEVVKLIADKIGWR
ncbi:transcriptional regulator [Paenibacillus alkaliterrae]|uniref:transcriptional regulator n=1 Tax=Paenibacillus alkaliterrae TaxID=320909 RepID=UPI001F1B10F2|nr:transcriptional regulator [Paenibacillus alkaliterrae]MCF2939031.1 transcriptional regulator [Paenibacillus alkaliterrae]